ncbi:glycerophosphodiester phosphodiesterase [Ligilactobacillus sp. WILCCON 0076]|uniref:Glycerophosphodiester phosphodiesterase n=1 Tax=Ligilactobacillus ubinensis TaxID=2876789 RepID=A0A9X2JM91_9LACO|nr:glycerophosphodiester phosphodiesterase [Ligilactobacillus ubinensis]MCP0887669.1 glycerophosphodiester phosphodiesterase [Ligilactobacillus ubinensis]
MKKLKQQLYWLCNNKVQLKGIFLCEISLLWLITMQIRNSNWTGIMIVALLPFLSFTGIQIIEIMHSQKKINYYLYPNLRQYVSLVIYNFWISILLFPFVGISWTLNIATTLTLPMTLINTILVNRRIFIVICIIIYFILFYVALLYIGAGPLIVMQAKHPFRQAANCCSKWTIVKTIFKTGLISVFVQVIIIFLLFKAQQLIDMVISIHSASLVASLLATVAWYLWFMVICWLFWCWLQPSLDVSFKYSFPYKSVRSSKWTVIGSILLIGATCVVCYQNFVFINTPLKKNIQIIAHRGVDNNNGLQNSVTALVKTKKKVAPNYVEMDIQETKDGRFIVSHDDNLKHLTGKNMQVQQNTLADLVGLKERENGNLGKVTSFKNYFAKAKQVNQHLIVELKVTPFDSKNMAELFARRFGKALLENKSAVHSMDYQTLVKLHHFVPGLKLGYIMPFNVLGVPNTITNFYSIEAITLNSSFVQKAHAKNKEVYVWTVDDATRAQLTIVLNVDGIITDQAQKVKQQLRVLQKNKYKLIEVRLLVLLKEIY